MGKVLQDFGHSLRGILAERLLRKIAALRQYLYFCNSKVSKASKLSGYSLRGILAERLLRLQRCVSTCTFVLVKQVKQVKQVNRVPAFGALRFAAGRGLGEASRRSS